MSQPRRTPPLAIVLEDPQFLVIDKPPGLLSVPAAGKAHTTGQRNLADAVRRHCLRAGETAMPVHRFDRDTSGVILFAKSEAARDELETSFRERKVEKRYLAVVQGVPKAAQGTIKSYIVDRGMTARSSRRPVGGGRPAVTRYRIVRRLDRAALVEAHPITGRFNQIRLHFADLGHPLVGERKYAVASRSHHKFRRPLLHAERLVFPHPVTGESVVAETPPPDDFTSMVEQLG